jgi:hypothetical protein
MGSTHRPTKIVVLRHVGLAGSRQDSAESCFQEQPQNRLGTMKLDPLSTSGRHPSHGAMCLFPFERTRTWSAIIDLNHPEHDPVLAFGIRPGMVEDDVTSCASLRMVSKLICR